MAFELQYLRNCTLSSFIVKAFVHCRLHYCNSLLTGAADVHFKVSPECCRSIDLKGTSSRDHITPVLTKLHWLLVRKRVMFRAVFKGGRLQVQPPPLKCWENFLDCKKLCNIYDTRALIFDALYLACQEKPYMASIRKRFGGRGSALDPALGHLTTLSHIP